MKRFNIHIPRLGNNPAFDWYVCLVFFALALIVVACIDMFLYRSLVKTDTVQVIGSDTPQTILNRAHIDEVVEQARNRDTVSNRVSDILLHDPSL